MQVGKQGLHGLWSGVRTREPWWQQLLHRLFYMQGQRCEMQMSNTLPLAATAIALSSAGMLVRDPGWEVQGSAEQVQLQQ